MNLVIIAQDAEDSILYEIWTKKSTESNFNEFFNITMYSFGLFI